MIKINDMKVTELQIGDWVNYAHKYMSKAMLCEVVAINNPSGEVILRNLRSDKVDEFGNKDYEVITTRYEDISPIPLTAEILEKNGFKTNNDHTLTGSCIYRRLCGKWNEYEVVVRLLNGWLKVRSYDERWCDLLEVHFQPRYVHELQHALRLCGLNELADNFIIE